ncbi:MAG: glutamate-5-semialdehyde dehydrogenase [Candidatus Firestonebacteria bacterium]
MNLEIMVSHKAASAKAAAGFIAKASSKQKNAMLLRLSKELSSSKAKILKANALDIKLGEKAGLSKTLLDRLLLNEKRLKLMQDGLRDVIKLMDPVGEITGHSLRPNGLKVKKMRVPLGVIGIIYEARPNVTIDAAALCLKAGNSVLLRGGKEALHSNKALVEAAKKALRASGFPAGCVEFIDIIDRSAVQEMIKQDKYIDVIIPRGSQELIKRIIENSSVPVIAHGEGNCHIFVDASADLKKAEEIVVNAKTQRPSVCNAAEKLLVHASLVKKFLPAMVKRLQAERVLVKGDAAAQKIKGVVAATEKDWYTEYHDLVMGVKAVKDLDAAIRHINKYGSHHTDAILTKNKKNGEKFLKEVDSAAVFVNASTRFTDGFEFGLGAEIGISTQKLHARGPMGLKELTCEKFIVYGSGQIRK